MFHRSLPQRRPTAAVAVIAALALAGACGDESATVQSGTSTETDVTGDDLQGRTFWSTGVADGAEPRDLAGDTAVSLRFTEDGRLIADAGCNTLSGPVDLDEGDLAVANLATTEVACGDELQRQDEWLRDLLRAAPSWELQGEELRVEHEDTTIALVDEDTANPDLPLRGTTWTVTTLLGDDGPAASQSDQAEKAWLRIVDDEIQADGGCNGLGGPVEIDDSVDPPRLAVGPLIGTQMACEEAVMKVENHLSQVLDGAVTATVDGDTLRLVNDQGPGLELTGQPPEAAEDEDDSDHGPGLEDEDQLNHGDQPDGDGDEQPESR